jgi:hypothetical protein
MKPNISFFLADFLIFLPGSRCSDTKLCILFCWRWTERGIIFFFVSFGSMTKIHFRYTECNFCQNIHILVGTVFMDAQFCRHPVNREPNFCLRSWLHSIRMNIFIIIFMRCRHCTTIIDLRPISKYTFLSASSTWAIDGGYAAAAGNTNFDILNIN